MEYADYEAAFNGGEDAVLVDRFFHDDIAFTAAARECRGKAELLDFLAWAHDGVREVMRPQNVLCRDDLIFADIDMDFHATKVRADFPFGALAPGDMVTVKFFVTYRLANGKVIELKAMSWPPGRGVTTIPRLGPHPSQIAAFHSYVSAFSNADCARFARFYQPDVLLELGALPPIRGAQGIVDFYKAMFERVRETLAIRSVEATADAIRLDATMRFTAIKDSPDFVMGALKKGEYLEGRVLVQYRIKDGLIAHISGRRDGELIKHGGSP